MEIKRDLYLNRLISGRGNGLIKIVTGLRGCGKSYLLFKLLRDYLLLNVTDKTHIIEIALDDIRNEEYLNPHKLVGHIEEKAKGEGMHYVLLDEIQMADNFVGALNSLLHFDNVDVYVTGSNSKFLSSDLATEFRGRGDEIRLHPLTFAEFLSASGAGKDDAWKEYTMYGGLPQTLSFIDAAQKVAFCGTSIAPST